MGVYRQDSHCLSDSYVELYPDRNVLVSLWAYAAKTPTASQGWIVGSLWDVLESFWAYAAKTPTAHLDLMAAWKRRES